MRALTAGVSSAVDGATYKTRATRSPSVTTAQAISGQGTINAMSWGVWQSRDHSAATRWRSAPTIKEIILHLAAGA